MSTATVVKQISWNAVFTPQMRGGDHTVRLIGVRGWTEGESDQNKRGIYDDLFVRIIGTQIDYWKASLDPTPALVQNPINPEGAAQLCPGIHFFAPGIHKGNPEWPCFIQAEDFHVWRLQKTGTPYKTEVGDYGIHIHSGGASNDTGRFSAGCQILWNPDGYWGATWFNFFKPLRDGMKAHCQAILPYMLINAEALPA